MSIEELLRTKREDILCIGAKHGARNVRVFGSAASGELSEKSDIDLSVGTGPNISAWFPARLILELEELLGRKVDVVTEDGIHWLLRRRIL
jgi:predicted nucleotidyltransferase